MRSQYQVAFASLPGDVQNGERVLACKKVEHREKMKWTKGKKREKRMALE
jgi:hypothetical protein